MRSLPEGAMKTWSKKPLSDAQGEYILWHVIDYLRGRMAVSTKAERSELVMASEAVRVILKREFLEASK